VQQRCFSRRCGAPEPFARREIPGLPSRFSSTLGPSETPAARQISAFVAMTPPTEDPRRAGPETLPRGETGPGGQEKGQSRDNNVAGWAYVMRPLRRKGAKASETVAATRLDTSASKEEEPRINSQAEDDRDSAQSKGSGYGLAHTETLREVTSEDGLLQENQEQGHATRNGQAHDNANDDAPLDRNAPREGALADDAPSFKTYKRRWFGVVQLALLNTIVSWDVSAEVLGAVHSSGTRGWPPSFQPAC
jgi:hypothetical protein